MDTKEAIKQELIRRELAKRGFLHYLQYTFPWFENTAYQWDPDNRLHDKIINALERVESGKCKRLMIFCPPRLGKSIISSQYFASWYLGKNPKNRIIQASYWSDLSSDFWRKTKRIVESDLYKNIFPEFQLAKDKREWGNWETSQEWWYYSVWVWGSTTGKWADLILIDDPVKDRIEADSATTQERNIDWYDSVATTRLQSQDSAIILIMTRWNIYDLWGYIEQEEWEEREQVVIQGIDDNGNEIIRPWKRDKWHMKKVRDGMLPKNRAALYQQDPIAATDGIFKREYFDYFKLSDFERADGILKKQDLKVWIFIDPAFSTDSKSDDAVVLLWAKHKISNAHYVLDVYAETSAPSRTLANIVTIYNKSVLRWYKVEFISVEQAEINKDQSDFIKQLREKMLECEINVPLRLYNPKQKKEVRIKDTLEPTMSQLWVKFRWDFEQKSTSVKMEKQFLEFPNWKHDDIPDTIEQMVTQLKGVKKKEKKKKRRKILDPVTNEYKYI